MSRSKPNPLMSAFLLEYDSTREYEERDYEDEYSHPDSYTSHDIKSIRLVANRTYDEYPDKEYNCLGAFGAVEGMTVYALYAIYSTGDSFSHSANAYLEPIAVFQTLSKAKRAQEQIKAHEELYRVMNGRYAQVNPTERLQNISDRLAVPLPLLPTNKVKNTPFDMDKINKELYSTHYQNEQDELCVISTPWVGYFESLSSLEIFQDQLKPDKDLEVFIRPRQPRKTK